MTDDELKSLLAGHSAEIRRHFDVAVERIETRVDLVSESIMQVDQKLDRSVARLAEMIESTAAETQAMVRFSHAARPACPLARRDSGKSSHARGAARELHAPVTSPMRSPGFIGTS